MYFFCVIEHCHSITCFDLFKFFGGPQVLVELAELQDREVGDGTTSVVIIAAELLKVSVASLLIWDLMKGIFLCSDERRLN